MRGCWGFDIIDAPPKLADYFFGSDGFYTIVCIEYGRSTDIQAVNVNGSLTQKAGEIRPSRKTETISLPTELYEIDFKRDRNRHKSKTTIALALNECWGFNMYLHTQKRKATVPSLAWDITIAGRPADFCPTTEPWDAIKGR